MTHQEITELFESFEHKTVLLIGDGMIDSYMWGDVNRQSPEAPVPVVDVNAKEKRLGGAANVAKNLVALGARTIFCGFVGDDDNGMIFRELMAKNGLEQTGLFEIPGRHTTIKTRVIVNDKHVLRVDEEHTEKLEDAKPFIDSILEIIDKYTIDVIIFQDYNKGVITPALISAVVAAANKKGIPTVVDPKKENFLDFKNVTLFKPNLKEIKEGLGVFFDASEADELKTNVSLLRTKLNAEMVLLTLSEQGVYIQSEKSEKHLPTFERKIVDVSGAGDTVVSVAALALAAGCQPESIALFANLAGGLVCEKVGVVPIDKNRLVEEAQWHHSKFL